MTLLTDSYAITAETLKKKFGRRGMETFYCATKEEARELVLSMIPEGSSVTWGGSESLKEAGICEAIDAGNYEHVTIARGPQVAPEETRASFGRVMCADYFLTSANAFTTDGELVNIDGNSNRVACIAHGPAHVIVLVSMNKMCASVEDAVRRVRALATPPNAVRFKATTPCGKTGICGDCTCDDCLCCNILVTRFCRGGERIKVVLCGEQLGL